MRWVTLNFKISKKGKEMTKCSNCNLPKNCNVSKLTLSVN